MGRIVASVVAGIILWVALAIGIDIAMSQFWPDYVVAKHTYLFTLQMMIARLAESTIALVIASWIAARIAPASRAASWALGIVMLLFFIPVHYSLWDKFPIWYHLYFLTSLVVIPAIMGRVMGARASVAAS
jgi:hypothetical protein